ncbi:MAG: hypothetical protein DYH18_06045 [Xanthomonadales bacterium PRO7]|nr:hypothetical protein [Xanthomonadales bacterium PRO7]
MNTGNPKFERDFESFLSGGDARLEALYRKLPASEPDASMDAAMQAMARRAVATTQLAARVPSHRRWLPLFSAAAVVALAVGFAFRLGPQLWQRPAAVAPAEPVSAPVQPAAKIVTSPQTAPAPTALAEPALEPPTPTLSPAARAAPRALQKMENTASQELPRPFPHSASALREPAPPPAAAEAKSAPSVPSAAAPTHARQSAEMESAGAPMQTLAAPAVQDRNATLYPEHWLANIRQMLRDNQREAALRSLDEFRKKYPDYVLPDDLRDLR